ncbi:MAG TPA: serine/threonine-protein kinase, partial [Nannocystaceae bacterium]|nr:serine/threonine-protein kinase [Nannocystaceae bacterium]
QVAAQPSEQSRFAERYRVDRLIGRGGMGEVRLCTDLVLGRDIALKTLREGGGSHERFLREARMQSRLEHPAVVPVYDVGAVEQVPWFTMKRVNGTTLAEVILKLVAGDATASEHFGRRRLLTDFLQVCQAIVYAHDHGVIHRDLKPANVMLGDYGEVYVLDWGIAKVLGASEPALDSSPPITATHQTAHGSVLGTLGYMPPEQLANTGHSVDRRADVYALGATLYELLTLQPLHARAPDADMIASTLAGADARARLRAPERDVPPELEAVCMRATATEPARRQQDVRELVAAIERYLDGDRDLQRRRALAREHAASAAELAAKADHDHGARAEAMREVGRALAFDPENPDALGTLGVLFLRPPRHAPPEVDERLRTAELEEARGQAKIGAFVGAAWLVFFAAPIAMGLREPALYAAMLALMVAIVALSIRRTKTGVGTVDVLVIGGLQALLMGLATRLFGVFVLVPGLVAATTGMYAFRERRHVRTLTVLGALSVLAPWLLERTGVIAPMFSFAPDAITIHPSIVSFSPIASELTLVVTNLAIVVMAGLSIAHARSALQHARRQLAVQAWQLEQVLPSRSWASGERTGSS